MREAVIVSTARTPIGKAHRGAFNDTSAQTLGGHAIRHAVAQVDFGHNFGKIVIGIVVLLFEERPERLGDQQEAVDVPPHEFDAGLRLAGVAFRGIGTDLGQGGLHPVKTPVGE